MKAEEVKELIKNYTEEIEEASERRLSAKIEKENYKKALRTLRLEGVRHLSAITGTDLGEEFEIIYHIECGDGTLLNMKMKISKEDGEITTVTDLFSGAILYERETMEMLGIKIKEHPDPQRLFLSEDWPENKHPLRKGQINYQEIAEKNISEIKKISKELDLNYKKLLKVEEKKRNRKSLKKWLERKAGSQEGGE